MEPSPKQIQNKENSKVIDDLIEIINQQKEEISQQKEEINNLIQMIKQQNENINNLQNQVNELKQINQENVEKINKSQKIIDPMNEEIEKFIKENNDQIQENEIKQDQHQDEMKDEKKENKEQSSKEKRISERISKIENKTEEYTMKTENNTIEIENNAEEMKDMKENFDDHLNKIDIQYGSISKTIIINAVKSEDTRKAINHPEILIQKNKDTIINWFHKDLGEKVFDSLNDNWRNKDKDFHNAILDKKDLLFVIEDIHGNIFGAYFDEYIPKNIEQNVWKPVGPNSFLFSLESNGRMKCEKKFPFKNREHGYRLYADYDDQLITIANGAIELWDEEDKHKAKCTRQEEYIEYGDETHSFTGYALEDKENFIPNRFVVYQMKEGYCRGLVEHKEYVEKQNKHFETITNNLSKMSNELKSDSTVTSIEKMSNMKFKELIYDSSICNWNREESTFDTRIFKRKNIIIMIEDSEDNIFGAGIKSEINTYQHPYNKGIKGNNIRDINAFVFSIKKNGQLQQENKYIIKYPNSSVAFSLYDKNSDKLFTIGEKDIVIMKKENCKECICEMKSFDYGTEMNPLRSKQQENRIFTVKKIRVFQMEKIDNLQEGEENDLRRRDEMIEEEKKQLMKYTPEIKEQYAETIEKIEEWTNTTFESVCFSTDFCCWKQINSSFDKHLFGRKRIAIIVEDELDNQYGVFISTEINKISKEEKGVWKRTKIPDPDCFIFSIKSNGRSDEPMKFDIKIEGIPFSFGLPNKDLPVLFSVGNEFDIYVGKEEYRDVSYCEQKSFDYNGYENVLNGKSGEKEYVPVKKVLVFQMYETEDQRQQREKKEESIRIQKEKQFDDETCKLNMISQTITQTVGNEIKQLEEWTKLHFDKVVFDTKFCAYSQSNSTFAKRIIGREKLAFLIEAENDVKFGAFIYEKIPGFPELRENALYPDGVNDRNSFLFTFKNDSPKKFHVKNEKGYLDDVHFILYQDIDWRLCIFGNCDIWIAKKGRKSVCCPTRESQYQLTEEAELIGKSGWDELTDKFYVKRIVVFQFQ